MQNGKQVNAYRKQPVIFVVDNGLKTEGVTAARDAKMLPEVVMVGYSDQSTSAESEKIFEKVESEPGFPGGNEKWKEYLQMNCKSTVATDNGAPEGKYTVLVQFMVDKEGNIGDIRPLTNHGYGMEPEVIRIITKGPKWIPAVQNGKKVRAYKKQAVTFEVSDGDKEPDEKRSGNVPEITVSKLKTLTVYEALGLPAGTEVISYNFTIDKDNVDIVEIPNTGLTFNPATKWELQSASAGKMITFDSIRIRIDGKEKKVASRVYLVVN